MAFSWLNRLFRAPVVREDPALRLYHAIVTSARQVDWYVAGEVPDSMTGRFEVLASLMSLAMARLNALGGNGPWMATSLSQIFARDLEQQLREDGFGDAGLVKQVSNAMAALSGQTEALDAVQQDETALAAWVARNFAAHSGGDAGNLDWRTKRLSALRWALNAQNDPLSLAEVFAQ